MDYLALGLVILVAGIHFLFGWKEYSGRNKPEFYEKFNIRLAENQRPEEIGRIIANAALFNALLGAGLIVSLCAGKPGQLLQIYLLIAIIIAGIVGGLTLKPVVAVAQSLPAAAALMFVLIASRAAEQTVGH